MGNSGAATDAMMTNQSDRHDSTSHAEDVRSTHASLHGDESMETLDFEQWDTDDGESGNMSPRSLLQRRGVAATFDPDQLDHEADEYHRQQYLYQDETDSESEPGLIDQVKERLGIRKLTKDELNMNRTLRGTGRLLRYPLLVMITLILMTEFLLYSILRLSVFLYEIVMEKLSHKRARLKLKTAQTYSQWCEAARQLDVLERRSEWRLSSHSPYYDAPHLQHLIDEFKDCREDGDVHRALAVLGSVLSKRNVAGMDNRELYSQTHWGTKFLITEYVKELTDTLRFVVEADSSVLSPEEKLEFFRKVKRSWGRTALLLSGGAGFGYYHLGVIKALRDAGCLPEVISGTSAGSMIAALVCVRTDEELDDLLTPDAVKYFTAGDEPFAVKAARYLRKGVIFDKDKWSEKLLYACGGDYTFEEAFQRTGRVLNISTVSASSKYVPALLLNHISAPNVVVWSAVLASCAIPNVIKPVTLMQKDPDGTLRPFETHGAVWADGSIKNDVPVEQMMQMHMCTYFVVSQVNPHVIPFFYDNRGSSGRPSSRQRGSGLRGGFLSAALESFLLLDISKWFTLVGEMDLLPNVFGQDWRFLFTQTERGTITVVPKPRLKDYLHIISDPSREAMEEFLFLGQQNTWPKLCRLQNHYNVELELLRCEQEVMMLLEQQQRGSRGASTARKAHDGTEPQQTPESAGTPSRDNWWIRAGQPDSQRRARIRKKIQQHGSI